MLNINNNVISLNRGDDVLFGVSITDETGAQYSMEAGDTLTFSVRALPEETSPVLLSVTSETERIYLRHADTAGIPAGKYSAAASGLYADQPVCDRPIRPDEYGPDSEGTGGRTVVARMAVYAGALSIGIGAGLCRSAGRADQIFYRSPGRRDHPLLRDALFARAGGAEARHGVFR